MSSPHVPPHYKIPGLRFAGTKAVLALVAVVLMSQHSHIIFLRFTSLEPIGDGKFLVTGKPRLRRTDNYKEWLGPDQIDSFNAWWSSPQAKNLVPRNTRSMINLHRTTWNILKEKLGHIGVQSGVLPGTKLPRRPRKHTQDPTGDRQITAIKTAQTQGTQAPIFIHKGKFDKP